MRIHGMKEECPMGERSSEVQRIEDIQQGVPIDSTDKAFYRKICIENSSFCN